MLGESKVAMVNPETGELLYGHARCVGSSSGCVDTPSDVRDLYLRVTTQGGWGALLPDA